MTTTNIEHIERIRLKLQSLLKDHLALQKENEKLRAEITRKAGIELEMKEKTLQMEAQINILKASTGQMDEASKKAFEKQINHYIREIDRCIAMLSQ
jgi:ABC-type iron transport system FetAB ATPase subunit